MIIMIDDDNDDDDKDYRDDVDYGNRHGGDPTLRRLALSCILMRGLSLFGRSTSSPYTLVTFKLFPFKVLIQLSSGGSSQFSREGFVPAAVFKSRASAANDLNT